MKHNLKKARALIKKHFDSWGSNERRFKQRLIGKKETSIAKKEATNEN